ncbi:MAG: ATP-binding protein [Flavobacteriales bacterium]|nr:ATP-binding protein [Flavobacteriales bacterium]
MNPFKHEYFLGYINQVLPQFVKVHFPSSVLLNGFTHFGKEFNGGLVGSFVVIEGDKYGFLGRITELSLPESERLSLNEKAFQTSDFHPTGKIEILLSFDLYNPFDVKKGLTAYPNIGAKVFVSSGELVQQYMSRFGVRSGEIANTIAIGSLVSSPQTKVKINLQSIFGRHCAIVGTTGGGKSYTVSKLVESLIATGNKAILIDATGEYSNYANQAYCTSKILGDDCFFHYRNLSVSDLFVLLKPSGQVQQPILLEAIQTLKIVEIATRNNKLPVAVKDGVYIKIKKEKKPYIDLYNEYANEIEKEYAEFNIQNLAQQLRRECVYDSDKFGEDITHWGDIDKRKWDNSTSLFLRTETLIQSTHFKSIFGFDKTGNEESELVKILDTFFNCPDKKILRIGFDNVGFDFQAREILANAIGKYMLNKARKGDFNPSNNENNKPVVLLIDEAHQFLNKKVKDEYFESVNLDAFDSIAKECRKHGLFLCIATQMPRDIPQGTLSQMGTFIAHRLINHFDKEAVSNACSTANKNTLDFLPILGEGEAILTGVDFPMPIIMKFDEPNIKPDSSTPKLN